MDINFLSVLPSLLTLRLIGTTSPKKLPSHSSFLQFEFVWFQKEDTRAWIYSKKPLCGFSEFHICSFFKTEVLEHIFKSGLVNKKL